MEWVGLQIRTQVEMRSFANRMVERMKVGGIRNWSRGDRSSLRSGTGARGRMMKNEERKRRLSEDSSQKSIRLKKSGENLNVTELGGTK